MSTLTPRVDGATPLNRKESTALAAAENRRFLDLVSTLGAAEWSLPTDCPGWDCRGLAAHVTGMAQCFTGFRHLFGQMSAATKATKSGNVEFIDALTGAQVAARANRTAEQVVAEYAELAPRAARVASRAAEPVPTSSTCTRATST